VSERRDTAEAETTRAMTVPPPAREPGEPPGPVPRTVQVTVPAISPLAPVVGWLTAWGAAVVAVACLREAGVGLGLGLGVATGEAGVEDRFLPGLWVMAVQAGAFVAGGYAAARLARAQALLHAGLAWALAMLATGVDAIVIAVRDGGDSILQRLGLPHWVHTGLTGAWEEALALACLALVGLAGALVGGSLGAAANR
jgi:hypothetical protein